MNGFPQEVIFSYTVVFAGCLEISGRSPVKPSDRPTVKLSNEVDAPKRVESTMVFRIRITSKISKASNAL